MIEFSGKSSEKSNKLFDQFKDASKQVCDDLGISYENVKAERYETQKMGVSYTSSGTANGKEFDFYLKTETKQSDVTSGRMSASLQINYDEGSAPFYFNENLDDLKSHSDFLSRWTAWAVFNFNLKHNPVNLESLFNEMDIRVYGIPRYTYPTMGEAHLLIGGINQFPSNKVLIYKFRHMDPSVKYRSFSYAFLVSHNNLHNFWVFFPNCGGLDSGGAGGDLRKMEELIGTIKTKVERKNFDIIYESLEKFLQKKAIGFRTELEYDDIHMSFAEPSEEAFGNDFVHSYSKFKERYDAKDYSGALRDLRALVQEAMEITCRKKNADLGNLKNRNIGNISGKMKDSQLIDESLYGWFFAFSAGANNASHRGYPTKQDMENHTLRQRVMVTFLLGTHLVDELESILCPPKYTGPISGEDFKMEIIKTDPIHEDQTFHEQLDGI
ncbi:MAG TPA: hypothetical protein VJ771_05670 [Candidatus Nitrosotalea sp.]|nr:hypothetical protein [Candidatus Nitrosotalea sp.]